MSSFSLLLIVFSCRFIICLAVSTAFCIFFAYVIFVFLAVYRVFRYAQRLDVVVRQGAAVLDSTQQHRLDSDLQLLAREDQALLVRRDALLVLSQEPFTLAQMHMATV